MKTRIASSIVLAAAIALGATGCGLVAPQSTTEAYAPSDGIDATVAGVEVRNLLLIADETGESFNVVFTAVNTSESTKELTFTFDGDAEAVFEVEPGTHLFGDPEGDIAPVPVAIRGAEVGGTVDAFLSIAGGSDVERAIPVLDGTLKEYERFVLPEGFGTDAEEGEGQTPDAAAKAGDTE